MPSTTPEIRAGGATTICAVAWFSFTFTRGVARASIYRILEELESLKLVQKLDVGQGIARYEPLDPSGDHHHHMVCDRCGDVIPFHDDELERTIRNVAGRVTFDVAEHEIVLHGACADCRR